MSLPFLLRDATIDDADNLIQFSREEFTRTFNHLYPPSELEFFLSDSYTHAVYDAWLLNQEYKVALLVDIDDNQKILGYCIACPCTSFLNHENVREHDSEIKRLYIHPSLFGKGAADVLMNYGFKYLKERAATLSNQSTHVWLGVYSENFRAINYYQKLGFEKVGEYIYEVGTCRDLDFIMNKLL